MEKEYKFTHIRSNVVEVFKTAKHAETVIGSPSWKPTNQEAKNLSKKMLAKKDE